MLRTSLCSPEKFETKPWNLILKPKKITSAHAHIFIIDQYGAEAEKKLEFEGKFALFL